MVNRFITCAADLVTTYEQTRAGFLSIALEKNKVSDSFVKSALAFKAMVAHTDSPEDFIEMMEIRPFMLTAAGLSDKSLKYLTESDQTNAIAELVENFLKPAGEMYIDETIYRYLLIKGDAVGGTMRNKIGALGQERLIRGILSSMQVRGIEYEWMANIAGKFPWTTKPSNDFEIEKTLKAICWCGGKGTRVLAFNLSVPLIKKNIDICLFDCDTDTYNRGKIVGEPEKILMLGELKGGIDPAGADEHWKTANTALERIRMGFRSIGIESVLTSFVGGAIERSMAEEIYTQLRNGTLSNAANLTDNEQLIEFCNWILEI